MKQKLCLVASLLFNPDIWVLDEPTVGLDVMAVEELKKNDARIRRSRQNRVCNVA